MKKNIALLLAALGSSLYGGWHEWSAKLEKKNIPADSQQRRFDQEQAAFKKEIILKRERAMLQFIRGKYDPNSLISKFPTDIIKNIHCALKKLDRY